MLTFLIIMLFLAPTLTVSFVCGFIGVVSIPATILFVITAPSVSAGIMIGIIGLLICVGSWKIVGLMKKI